MHGSDLAFTPQVIKNQQLPSIAAIGVRYVSASLYTIGTVTEMQN
jgi:hypothetical protein